VATRQVVHKVVSIDGAALAEEDPLPDGWLLQPKQKRLYRVTSSPPTLTLSSIGLATALAHVRSIGSVNLIYEGGWGAEPSIVLAILKKAAAIMRNWHDDTVSTRGTDASRPAPAEENWTEEEIKALGRYRNLSAYR
jgi:hypothetical protein